VCFDCWYEIRVLIDYGLGASHPRQPHLLTNNSGPHDAVAAAQRPYLQIIAFQKNRASSFHFIKRSINIARFELDSAAAVQDNVSV
jgi:hypothetical protein